MYKKKLKIFYTTLYHQFVHKSMLNMLQLNNYTLLASDIFKVSYKDGKSNFELHNRNIGKVQ